jgi:predicted membrane-bound mannosyltransferase
LTDLAMPVSRRPAATWATRISTAITLETLLWSVLIVLAIWTRFWDLGYRAQHHDESLHSYYSWLFATGERLYTHHPLMHGPFLFHANALVYKLFGADDTTSRLVPALFGVAIVWMPWLLRSPRLLGQWGALATGFMLLISPSMLYYTRYIRHDPYMVAGCLLLAIAIFRYLEFPQRRWIVIAFASVGFLLTNHELVLATFLIMVILLWGSLLITHLRPLIAVHVVAVVMLAFVAWRWLSHPWPPIPWSRPATNALTGDQFFVFVQVCGPAVIALLAILGVIAWVRNTQLAAGISVGLVALAAGWIAIARDWIPAVRDYSALLGDEGTTFLTTSEFYWALLQHPFVQGVLVVAAVFLIGCAATIRWMLADMPDEQNGIDYIFGDADSNTVAYGLRHALHDGTGLYIGIFVAIAIWVVLFTSFFTNPAGIGSGTYETNGTLLYWLGQHDVQRGAQPWFYFIILALQYEWLSFLLAITGSILIAWRTLRWIAGGTHGPNYFWYVFIVGWFVGMFLILSWAGEKMPWLIIHIVLPAALVGGWIVNTVIEGALAWYRQRDTHLGPVARYGGPALIIGLLVAATSWFYLGARFTYGEWVQLQTGAWVRTATQAALDDWWMLALPPLVALFLIAAAIWIIGSRRTIYSTLAAMFAILSLFQVHAGFRMTYIDGDLAVDTLIYNTISADMTQFTADMSDLSMAVYGDNSITVAYDQCRMQWPTNWYMKSDDFPNANFTNYMAMGSPDVILVAHDSQGCGWPDKIPGYTRQVYSLRVHESEMATYRNFAIAPEIPVGRSAWQRMDDPHDIGAVIRSIGSSMKYATTPEGQLRLFRLVAFRDPAGEQTVYPMSVWIRDDLLPEYNEIRYGEINP